MSRILHSYYKEWARAIVVDLERLWGGKERNTAYFMESLLFN